MYMKILLFIIVFFISSNSKEPSTRTINVGTTKPMETTIFYLIDNITEEPWSGVTETQKPDVSKPPSGENPSM